MWDLFKGFGLMGQIGMGIGFFCFVAGMATTIVVAPVAGTIVTVGTVALLAFCFWYFFGSEVRRRHLLRDGVRAEATILAVDETGMTVQNNYPVARIHFRVEPPGGGEPYEATAKCIIDRFEIPAFQPGDRVPVVVDPKHPQRVQLA